MIKFLRLLFFALIFKPIIFLIFGVNVRNRERLPKSGPAIIAANHNSHLDTIVLMSLLPLSLLSKTRPVAAADYFLKNKLIGWFALNIIGIIPIKRGGGGKNDPLAGAKKRLDAGDILILFPEGSRGEPEELTSFKKGVAWLVEAYPHVPTYPVFMHGLGKAMPKGEKIILPFFLDIFAGEPVEWSGDRNRFIDALKREIQTLAKTGNFADWE
jgi:1-acyl-sn-glycerol-3-phosphate acyltransferase